VKGLRVSKTFKRNAGGFTMNLKRGIPFGLGGLIGGAIAGLSVRFYLGHRRADQMWASARYPKLKDVGTVKRLTILPLIDWYTASDPSTGSGQVLVGEPGVSYLVRADDTTILFDVGYNTRGEHPSPLLRNMAALGVEVTDVDMVVISHAHEDHVGGMSHMMRRTFALSGQPVDLKGIPAYVPVPLSNPTAQVTVVDGPRVIAPGVASMGPIPRQLFFLGWTPEQSLAVNVEGKGIVVIIGCGHPTLQRIVDRAEMLFDEPLHGIVGGLHYPVTGARTVILGIPVQKIVGTGKLPWRPITRDEVQQAIAYLQRRNPQLVALSPHDSCDWSIEAFRRAFGGAYQEVKVGEEITVA
jgi:7,8-dihydropterin-6-yl-methyl-4-(beta-D-ribofuranosyl)aminobenzene 5'-phosphate synthase